MWDATVVAQAPDWQPHSCHAGAYRRRIGNGGRAHQRQRRPPRSIWALPAPAKGSPHMRCVCWRNCHRNGNGTKPLRLPGVATPDGAAAQCRRAPPVYCPTNPQVCACTLSRRFPTSFDVQRHGSAQFQSMPIYPGRCASLRANRCFCHRTVIHGTPGSARGYPDRPHTKGARLCYTLHLPACRRFLGSAE